MRFLEWIVLFELVSTGRLTCVIVFCRWPSWWLLWILPGLSSFDNFGLSVFLGWWCLQNWLLLVNALLDWVILANLAESAFRNHWYKSLRLWWHFWCDFGTGNLLFISLDLVSHRNYFCRRQSVWDFLLLLILHFSHLHSICRSKRV